MKESIGNAFIFNLVIIFIGIAIALLVGSISYSKAFKIRNRIIATIENCNGYTTEKTSINNLCDRDGGAKAIIDEDLRAIGYKISTRSCPIRNGVEDLANSDYHYCIYEFNNSRGTYYGVTVYISFDIPIIGDTIKIPIYGETKTLYNETIEW